MNSRAFRDGDCLPSPTLRHGQLRGGARSGEFRGGPQMSGHLDLSNHCDEVCSEPQRHASLRRDERANGEQRCGELPCEEAPKLREAARSDRQANDILFQNLYNHSISYPIRGNY